MVHKHGGYSELSITIHSFSMAGYVTILCGTYSETVSWAVSVILIEHSLWFHHIFLLTDTGNLLFLQLRLRAET